MLSESPSRDRAPVVVVNDPPIVVPVLAVLVSEPKMVVPVNAGIGAYHFLVASILIS